LVVRISSTRRYHLWV